MKIDKIKKKQSIKATKKIKRLQRKKKLKRHVIDAFHEIRSKKFKGRLKKFMAVNEEWEGYKKEKDLNIDDVPLPLDMIDEDVDWEGSALVAASKKKEDEEEDLDSYEMKSRQNKGEKDVNYKELLPIKVDGKLVGRSVVEDEEMDDENNGIAPQKEKEHNEEDVSGLSAAELLKKREELLIAAKSLISSNATAIIADPQEQIHKLKGLLLLCSGQNLHSLVRETVQKLALVSAVQIFVNIIPGYVIRLPSEAETQQKLKKETKKLYAFEQSLLKSYLKYLQLLERNTKKLLSFKNSKPDTSLFSYKLAMLSLDCFCRLLKKAPHFNYATNILTTVVRLSACKVEEAIDPCCEALNNVFRYDLTFRNSAFGARTIASVVKQKKCDISPKLLATFLSLNIKEVNKGVKDKRKGRLLNKKLKLKKERQSKSNAKYAKQLSKIEADLKEIEAAEALITKMKFATETMTHVFGTYFLVLKRMPKTNLLEPVLEGLSRFAHLLNIEFFDDIVNALESLVEQQHLHLLSSLHCIHAVFVILSGEGASLNIDPFRFYRSMYRLLTSFPFEKDEVVSKKELNLVLRTLEFMFIVRKKQVPLSRVAAFVKRLLDITLYLPSMYIIAILAFVRSLLSAHPRCTALVDGSELMLGGIFNPAIDDPDCCNALSTSVEAELKVLSNHPDRTVVLFARHILSGLPSAGLHHLPPQFLTRKSYDWLDLKMNDASASESPYYQLAILDHCKKKKSRLTSKNFQVVINQWCESYMKK